MITKLVEYYDGNTVLEGLLAYDAGQTGKRPAVLVAHNWTGRDTIACDTARRITELGYIGFALDMFGKGVLGNTTEEKQNLIKPFIENRAALERRMQAALETVKAEPLVDVAKVAAFGYCFGGLCVLDLARSGAKLNGVVSFHGLLNPPPTPQTGPIHTKILVLHGYDDPMVVPGQVMAFADDMTRAKADWQIHMYGHVRHGFTNVQSNDPAMGLIYDAKAEQRSWIAASDFLREIFT
jgi:dienelactone hydrolase